MEDLELTLAALDQQTFADVARERHVSQSTVSRSVQRVEAAIGQKLFVRDGRVSVRRGDAAETIEHIRSICALWNDLLVTSVTQRSLSIFCTVTASQAIVPELLAAFRRAHPEVHLELRTGPASAALDAVMVGDVDAAIAPMPRVLPRGLDSLPVAELPLQAVVANDQPIPDDVWTNTHVIVPRPGVTRDLVDQWCRRNLRHGFSTQECAGHEEVIALAALGSGIGIVPALVIESSALQGRLRMITTPSPLPTMRIALCARRRSISDEPLRELWQMLMETPKRPTIGTHLDSTNVRET
jgi:LysR family transcriptional regulator, positive regulator for ilvC